MAGQGATILLALSTGFGLSLSQSITPMPYNQNDSVSSCTHGLISDIDTVVFKYVADLSGDLYATYVYFQTKKKYDTKYNFLCHMNITDQCNNEHQKEMCTCRTITQYVMEITVNIKAQVSCNGASLRGNIINSKMSNQIRSKESWFPEMYESTNTQGHLTINNKEIKDEDLCYEIVKGNVLVITYTCISPAHPCLIEISTDKSTQKVQGNGTVNYYGSFNKSQDIKATIRRAACTLLGKISTTTCYISMDIDINMEKEKSSSTNEMARFLLYIIIITTVSSILTIGGIILAFVVFRKRFIESTFLDPTKHISQNITRKRKGTLEEEEQLITHEDLKDGQIDTFKSKDNDYTNCSRNYLHERFISMEDFNLLELPENMQDEDIYELIKAMADLTVMVTYIDDTDESTMGTGWIGYVVQYTSKDNRKCSCKECKLSPSEKFGEITVYTSTDVVPANSGGMQVTCSLIVNDDENKVLCLTGCEVEAKFSKCRIKFKTCNMNLLQTLEKQRQKINDLNYKINNKYKKLRDGSLISNDEERLAIIVSYIHGVKKCVSLGSWTNRYAKINKKNNIEITQYTYTNPTCSGSTGAYVYILGRAHCGWLYQHYHVGVNHLDHGFCGYGIDAM